MPNKTSKNESRPQAPGRREFVTRAAAVSTLPLLASTHAQTSTASAGPSAAPERGQRFEFGLMGDMPYTYKQEAEYELLLDDLNGRDLAFVLSRGP